MEQEAAVGDEEEVQPSFKGLLVVDKPSGVTSHDVVDQVRRVYRTKKVGHAGTLDPPATGVLLIGLGQATRLLAFLQGLPKSYRAVAKFGVATTTQDAEGEVVAVKPADLKRHQVEAAAESFKGEIRQVPPMVSAVKIGGEPLYVKARRGETVPRQARSVKVYDFAVEDFDPDTQVAKIFVRCSSGTYVRTLASDLGDALGTGAHLLSLRRLSVGSFTENDAVRVEELEQLGLKESLQRVLPPSEALRDFASLTVDDESVAAVSHGRALDLEADVEEGSPVAILDKSGNLLGVYRRKAKGLKPEVVLA